MSERLDTIAAELLALRTEQGVINPSEVVRWARANADSRLHGALNWDDEVAAERYRIWQVRSLISVHIVDVDGGRKFVSLSIDRAGGHSGGYRPISEVMDDETLRDVMLKDAMAELERVQKRFEKLKELSAVWEELHKVKRRRSVRKVAETPAAA
jgi:hypothetical protein